MFVEEQADRGLKDIHNELMLLCLHEDGLDFASTKLPQPCQVSVLMLILVEKSELFGAVLHHCWDCACHLVNGRPVARNQHICAERDPRDLCFVKIKPLKLDLKLLRTIYIREHLRHLVNRADTALHL